MNMIRHHLRVALVLLVLLLAIPVAGAAAQGTARNVYITTQRFDGGEMIWRADTSGIYVFLNNGQGRYFPAYAYSGLPDNPYFNVPAGHVRPILGFGKIWGAYQDIRNQLGWAAQNELGLTVPVSDTPGGPTCFIKSVTRTVCLASNNTWYTGNAPTNVDAAVLRFDVSPQQTQPGESLTVSWQVTGGEIALLEAYTDGSSTPFTLLQDLPLTGSATVTVPGTVRNHVTVGVWVANRARGVPVTMYERLAGAEQTILVDFVPAQSVRAAYQPYEDGFMIWRADTGAVMAFWGGSSGQWVTFPEARYGPLPDNPIPPRAGYILPINGFGRVWGNHDYIRDRLGWPTGQEQSYTMQITPGASMTATYTTPDGRTIATSRSFWSTQ